MRSTKPCRDRLPRLLFVGLLLGPWLAPSPLAAGATSGAPSAVDLRLYEAVRTSQAPVLDGRLDEACWASAPLGEGFVRVISEPGRAPSVQTRFQILYDDVALYVGVTCFEPHPERLRAAAVEDGSSAVCGDDAIEMFFQPDAGRSEYFQLAANSRGVRYDGCGLDPSWRGEWTAMGSVGKGAWYLECRIALASFPERRAAWRFNLCREFRSSEPPEFHCWSDTGGAFHTPARFGHLAFSGAFAGLRRGYLIEAAGLAARSLDKEGLLANRLAEMERLREAAPADRRGELDQAVRNAQAARGAVEQRYATRTELTVAEWQALNADFDRLLAGLDSAYWELKFMALFGD